MNVFPTLPALFRSRTQGRDLWACFSLAQRVSHLYHSKHTERSDCTHKGWGRSLPDRRLKTMRDYTKIIAWQKADDLAVAVYEVSRGFPKDEVYALTSQLRRAAYSVPANVTEGASRHSQRDYLHFLYIARGSLNETRYFVHLAKRLGYLNKVAVEPIEAQAEETARTLTGLIQAVEKESGPLQKLVAQASSLVAMALSAGLCAKARMP